MKIRRDLSGITLRSIAQVPHLDQLPLIALLITGMLITGMIITA